MLSNYSDFGRKLEQLRREKGVSQQNLVNDLAIGSQATYSSWETGRTAPNIDYLIKLADYFSITLDDLIRKECRTFLGTYKDYSGKGTYYKTREKEAVAEKDSIGHYIVETFIEERHALIMDGGNHHYRGIQSHYEEARENPASFGHSD